MTTKTKIFIGIGVAAVLSVIGYIVVKGMKPSSSGGASNPYEGKYIFAPGNPHTWLVKNGERVRWDNTGITSTNVKKVRIEVPLADLIAIKEAGSFAPNT